MINNGNSFSSPNGNGSYSGEYSNGLFGPGKEETSTDGIKPKHLLYLLWNHKWKIIGSVVICSVLAGVIAYTTTPIYRSEGSMLISQQQSNMSAGDSELANLLSSTYGISTGSTIANELQVLRSRRLSMEIADTLMKQQLMQNGRQYPVLFRSYPEDSMMTTQDTVAMRIRNNISFLQTDRDADMISIGYESPSPVEAANIVNQSMELYSQLSTRQNRRSANSAVEFLEEERARIKNELNNVETQLQAFMNQERLIEVDAQTNELITRIAELESRKQEARVKLVTTNSAIEQYQERLNSIKPGLAEQYSDATGPNMTRLQYQLAELEMEKMQLLANNPTLEESPSSSKELQGINDEITVYKNRISELTNDLIEEGDQYLGFLGGGDGNIAQTVSEINQQLIKLQVEQQQAQAQTEVIDAQLAEQQEFFNNLPDNMMNLARLKRDVKINEELYLTVSQQYAEMSLWKQTQFGLGRTVDGGYVPESPIKPDKKIYLLVGFLLGGILSVGYIFTREAFNTRIDGVEKLKKHNIPLLAVIPDMAKYIKKKYGGQKTTTVNGKEVSTSMITMLDGVSPISESFRRLETNIIYSNPDQKFSALMVTSATQGEGKTTVSANLGVVLAEAGYEVVIVDTDLRRPKLHSMFGARKAPGILEVLFDNLSLEKAIQETPMERLSVLSSGKESPNPAAVTQSEQFQEMIHQLKESYDIVLLDTPPYGIITDASAMVGQADGVIVATRFNETTEAELSHVLNNLHHINAHIIGTVLTAFDYNQTSDYYYGSYYYRGMYEDYSTYQSEEG